MSGFIPGLASAGIPLYEQDTEIVVTEGTPTNLSFPDPVPNQPQNIAYTIVPPAPPSPNPVNNAAVISYIISCTISISWATVGDKSSSLTFRLGGGTNISVQDYLYVVPMAPVIDIGLPGIISFTGLVRVLPGQLPKLYIQCTPNTDTTAYSVVTAPSFKYKTL